MQPHDTHTAPLVPVAPADEDATVPYPDGGSRRSHGQPFPRPPDIGYASAYTRGREEIVPLVADLR